MPGGLSAADWSQVPVRSGRDPGWEAGPGKKASAPTRPTGRAGCLLTLCRTLSIHVLFRDCRGGNFLHISQKPAHCVWVFHHVGSPIREEVASKFGG